MSLLSEHGAADRLVMQHLDGDGHHHVNVVLATIRTKFCLQDGKMCSIRAVSETLLKVNN